MNVLVTGGAGYIGSHAALRLLHDGHAVTIIDDLSRGHHGAVDALRSHGDLHFLQADLADIERIAALMSERAIELVMHFAALAYVGESFEQPLRYYRVNAGGTLALLEAMDAAGVWRIVHSSSCAVYGEPEPDQIPIRETAPLRPINPYGRSKQLAEQALTDHSRAKAARGESFAFAALRYFNVAGADPNGRIGEDHRPETHLVPICLEAAAGRRASVIIFGEDYATPDGTCIRDYVDVTDLIDAHVTVMNALTAGDCRVYNIGTGRGHSVREVIDACRRVTATPIPERIGDRRAGDPPVLFADPSRIRRDLAWSASRTTLEEIIETAWRWMRDHPRGYT